MNERRVSTMPSHRLMPHSIPEHTRQDRRRIVRQQINRKPADDPYDAGFDGSVSGHVLAKAPVLDCQPMEYICFPEVMPGEKILVTAQLKGVGVLGEFTPLTAKTPGDPPVFSARASGLGPEGFFSVSVTGDLLTMWVGGAGGFLQRVDLEMPQYDPNKLVVEHKNGLIIASA